MGIMNRFVCTTDSIREDSTFYTCVFENITDPTVIYNGSTADYEDCADYLRINTIKAVVVG